MMISPTAFKKFPDAIGEPPLNEFDPIWSFLAFLVDAYSLAYVCLRKMLEWCLVCEDLETS
jgi:hypothetical protein